MGTFNRDRNYNLLGYHKKASLNIAGDVVTVEFYSEYDEAEELYSELQVKETRVFVKDISDIIIKKTTTIDWYSHSEIVNTKVLVRHYLSEEGFLLSKRYKKNLTNKATIWIIKDLIDEFGQATGMANALEFLGDIGKHINLYSMGKKDNLLDAISDSTRTYITAARKTSLDDILNV